MDRSRAPEPASDPLPGYPATPHGAHADPDHPPGDAVAQSRAHTAENPPLATAPPAEPDLEVDEAPLPRRVRRPVDAVRLVVAVLGTIVVVLLAAGASRTTTGLNSDLLTLGDHLPSAVLGLVSVVSALAGLVFLPYLVVQRLLRRRYWSAGMVALSMPIAIALTALVAVWLRSAGIPTVAEDFIPLQQGSDTATLSGFLAALVAAGTAGAIARRTRTVAVSIVLAAVLTGLLSGQTTVLSALLVLVLGRVAGLLVRLAAGSATVRPDGHVVAGLVTGTGHPVRALRALPDRLPRRYLATVDDGSTLDVVVLERDQVGAGLLSLAWRTIRTRGEVLPREELSMEGAVERRTVLALACAAAGVRTPRLVAAVAAEPDAAVVVYERQQTRRLADVERAEVADAVVADVWRQVQLMHAAGIAHRALSPRSLRVDDAGRAWVYEAYSGEVAAPAFARQLDVVHTIVALATVVGAERAVSSARHLLGPAALGTVVPLLQPIALPPATRDSLHSQPELLAALIAEVAREADVQATQPVELERFKPRTLLTGIGLAVALYLIFTELANVDFGSVFGNADWRWVAIAFLGVVATYIGTAAALLGFVKQHVPYFRTICAQLALSFVKLFAPSTIGNAAVNIRLLTCAGIPAAAAAASIAAGQLAAFAVTLPLLLVLGVLTGQAVASGLAPSPTALGIIAVVLGALALLLLVGPIRERLRRLWSAVIDQGLPQLLEAVQTPHKLVQGVGGNLLLTVGYSVALYGCVRAVGADIGVAAVAVVFLTGNTVGSAVPTPGGLGAVEAALVAGLGAAGVAGGLAVPAVLLFRILSFWLPMVPGYVAWNRMQAKGYL